MVIDSLDTSRAAINLPPATVDVVHPSPRRSSSTAGRVQPAIMALSATPRTYQEPQGAPSARRPGRAIAFHHRPPRHSMYRPPPSPALSSAKPRLRFTSRRRARRLFWPSPPEARIGGNKSAHATLEGSFPDGSLPPLTERSHEDKWRETRPRSPSSVCSVCGKSHAGDKHGSSYARKSRWARRRKVSQI
jgi:hypothetical protein